MYILSIQKIFRGTMAIMVIPIVLIIFIIKPLFKIKFGYISVDRVGHFGLDLADAIAKKNENNKEFVLYYLQGESSNLQLESIAKRELNIHSHYRYFVYAYTLLGLSSEILKPNRHNGGSFNIDGSVFYSKYNISLLDKENKAAESYLEKYGWSKGEKFICLNVRDSAFFNEFKESRHACRNSNIDDYEKAIYYLLDLGYWVIRMGKKVEKPLKIKHDKLIDYGSSSDWSDLLDIWFCKECYFFISTSTGIDSVALMFKKPIVIVNLVQIAYMYSWVNSITTSKRLFWKSGLELTLRECLDNQNTSKHKESGITVVDLTPDEIESTVKEMVGRLDGVALTEKQIKNNEDFWSIMKSNALYDKCHGVRDPNASYSASFLDNNPKFLNKNN